MVDTDPTAVLLWVRTATAASALLAVVSHYASVGGLGGLTGELIAVAGTGVVILLYAWGQAREHPRRDGGDEEERRKKRKMKARAQESAGADA